MSVRCLALWLALILQLLSLFPDARPAMLMKSQARHVLKQVGAAS